MILDTLINTYTTGTQSDPSITALNDGGFVVSWQSIDQDGSSSGIYAQRYDVNGVEQGSEFRVNTYTINSQGQPSIAALNDGGFVVSWKSFAQDGSNWGIYAQRYDASGLALGGEFLVNTHIDGLQTNPSIAALNDGGFVVSWTSDGQDGDGFGVYAQRYNANGIAQGNEFRVNTYITSEQSTPTIAVLNDGRFVVSWTSYGQDGSGYGIYAQRYDSNGLTQGSEFRVNSTTFSDQHNQWIAALNDGGFVVSWMSYGQDGSEYGIYAQRYDASGVAQAGEFRVNTSTSNHQVIPSITELNDGGFVISWSSLEQDGSDYGIYAQRYDSNGVALGSEFRVNTYTIGDQNTLSITALNDGGFVVSWMSNGQDGSDWGVYGKRYDFNGNEIEWKQINVLLNEVFEDSIVTITFDQLLANDIVVYGASQTIIGIDTTDSRGSVVIDTVNQTITYSADADEFDLLVSGNSTTDTFKYILQSSTGETNIATVSINVVGFNDGIELFGTVNPDTLIGTNGEDVIMGDNGDDVIIGGDGADELFGENGDDTLNGGNSIDFLFGGNGNDNLDGGAGDDYLYGGVGGDYMDGGDGVDTVSYDSSLVVIDVDLSRSGSQDWGAVGDIIVNVENLIGSDFNDRLSAAVAGSTIYGGLGSDTIYGDAGDDALYGDDGNDIFYAGGGDDTVYGGDGDDTIYSQGGSNLLIGGEGADSLNGFGGVAIASYSASTSAVNINLTTNVNTGGTAHGDILSGVPNIIGSDFADTIIGDGFANDLFGGAGDDLLAGMGYGGNHIDGGAGIDTVSYADSLQVVNVDLAITTSQGWGASGDTIVDVENLIGSAFNDILKATVSGSTIFGGDGNDTISGKAGSDVLLGESGNDIFYAGDGDDVIHGGSGDDLIYSQGGNNILTGGGGADTLNGFTGIATASYADSSTAVNINMATNINTGGDAQGDILQGILNVTGSSHSDSLTGDDKNNILIGGVGNDTLTGGSGFDIFKYLADADSGAGSGNRDIITDFNQSQGDKIDLLEIIDGDFIFMGINSLSGTANEIIYTQTGGNTVIGVDSNADGLADFEIELTGLLTLEATDFQL